MKELLQISLCIN